jgi:hypothetical protein
MDRNKYAKIELRPNKATKISIRPESISPNYELKSQPNSNATDTGHLELFRLEPLDPALPSFSARWDTKPNTIDIDLIGDPKASKAFKAGLAGYGGHHTTILSDSPRIYRVDIETPSGRVFSAEIDLEIELGLYLKDDLGGLRDAMKDQLGILINCPQCGPTPVSGPPFSLDACPSCGRVLKTATD